MRVKADGFHIWCGPTHHLRQIARFHAAFQIVQFGFVAAAVFCFVNGEQIAVEHGTVFFVHDFLAVKLPFVGGFERLVKRICIVQQQFDQKTFLFFHVGKGLH